MQRFFLISLFSVGNGTANDCELPTSSSRPCFKITFSYSLQLHDKLTVSNKKLEVGTVVTEQLIITELIYTELHTLTRENTTQTGTMVECGM